MTDKYYTPSIEEFHVGFEFEYKEFINGIPKWNKGEIKNSREIHQIDVWLKEVKMDGSQIRVKYLDKEDIESLGWENVEDRGMSENYGYSFQKPIVYLSGGTAYYRLRYWFTTHRVRIEPLGGPIFDGTIRNKSELKVLLKQLGISG